LVFWGEYEGALRDTILTFKHGKHDELCRPLAQRLAKRIEAEEWQPGPDLVTAIPSHPVFRIRRGYSAAESLARALSRTLCLTYRPTLKRHDLGRQARRTRAQRTTLGARTFVQRKTSPSLLGRSILLIDDVTTTGATFQRAARVLLEAGAEHVFCAALARTPDPRRVL
jgi:ComF family protein